jgi:pimeloyl-ACP methyl ester carboxylesterase
MAFVSVHGTRVRVREAGAERRGTPLLLIHGAGTSSAVWLGLLGRLGRHRRVVAPDLPGHGRSEGRLETVEEWRDAIGMTAATLCLGPAILVGHSLGGAAAVEATLAWPDKVAGLILLTTAPRFAVSPQLLETLATRFARWPEVYAELGYSPEAPEDTRRRGASIACTASQAQTLLDFRAAATVDLRARLGEVRCRTWAIGGADDLITPPKWTDALAGGIAGAQRFVFPRVGHMPMHEAPDAVAGAILEFAAGFPARTV